MQDYAAMNKAYVELIPDPKPARTCVAVAELPMGTDVCNNHMADAQHLLNANTGRDRMYSPSVSMFAAVPCIRTRTKDESRH